MISKPGSTTVASFDFHFVLIIIFFSMRERAVFCKSCNLIPSAGSTVFSHPACLRELYLILCVLSRLYKIETEKQWSLSISKRSFRQYCDFLPAPSTATSFSIDMQNHKLDFMSPWMFSLFEHRAIYKYISSCKRREITFTLDLN